MVYTVEYMSTRRSKVILRIVTTEDELYKVMPDGSRNKRRNCEYHPECTSQEQAHDIAYRMVDCDGTPTPRIACIITSRGFYKLRTEGSRKPSPEAYEALRERNKTAAGRQSQNANNATNPGFHEYLRKRSKEFYNTHKEYYKKYYKEHKAEYIARNNKYRNK